MSREAFFGDPEQHGRKFVFDMLRHLVRAKALPLHGAEMAADVVFGFIRRYHRWLEIKPDRDNYRLDELLNRKAETQTEAQCRRPKSHLCCHQEALGVETGRSCESDVDRSKETGEEGGDAEDGYADLPGHEFTDCGTQAELSAATIALEISSRNARRCRIAGTGCAG